MLFAPPAGLEFQDADGAVGPANEAVDGAAHDASVREEAERHFVKDVTCFVLGPQFAVLSQRTEARDGLPGRLGIGRRLSMPLSLKKRLDCKSQGRLVNDRSHSETLQQSMNEQTHEQIGRCATTFRSGGRI